MNCSREQLMHIIEVSSFAIDDIKLYLDTHRDCGDALAFYNEQMAIRNKAIKEYTENFGPIQAYNVNTNQGWSWIDAPWPWEGEC